VLCGFVPAIILIMKRHPRKSIPGGLPPFVLGIIGVSLNRWVMVLQVMAVPVIEL
jgi:hypothetical protein